jgi:hypothetical protein
MPNGPGISRPYPHKLTGQVIQKSNANFLHQNKRSARQIHPIASLFSQIVAQTVPVPLEALDHQS